MDVPYFTGKPENQKRTKAVDLPISRREGLNDPGGYLADEGLVDAVNVALVLGQPLLLTGEPGTGKTLLAYAVAAELGLGEVLKFETKSNSSSRDLFYIFDTVGRFHAAQTGAGSNRNIDYMTYNALGKAILLANQKSSVQKWLPDDFIHDGPKRSLVLIDEIDKAPRDFPNDILNEIEELYFRVPQIDNEPIRTDKSMQPVVFVTSNSEKHLPDAFLRRCIYYNIPFPSEDQLKKIVKIRVGKYLDRQEEFLSDVLDLFEQLRSPGSGIQKKPATAELLGWIIALKEMTKELPNPMRNNDKLDRSLSVLVKNADDVRQATRILEQWQKNKK